MTDPGRKGKTPDATSSAEGQRIGGLRLEKGQRGSREAGEEEGQEVVARQGTVGLRDGKFGEELLTATFRARFRREKIPRRLPVAGNPQIMP